MTARRLLANEWAQYVSLVRWLTRRPTAGPGETAFSHFGGVGVLVWAFIIGSAVETVVLHVVLPWETVRLVCDVLSVWGVVWMLGLMADLKVTPHLVAEPGLVLRHQRSVNLLLPWSRIASVQATGERVRESGKLMQLDPGEDGATLNVVIASMTNVEVTLRGELLWDDQPIHRVRFYADDPKGLAAACAERVLAT
jgi:hypothetical protein